MVDYAIYSGLVKPTKKTTYVNPRTAQSQALLAHVTSPPNTGLTGANYNTGGWDNTSSSNNSGSSQQSQGGASEPSYSSPAYSMPSFDIDYDAIWNLAGQYADNEINPQLAEIDRQLQEAGYSAEESSRAINEAYPIARRSLQKSIYENMVAGEQGLAAMGTGRGGGRQELLARAGEREATGLETIETSKQRELGAINRALENYRNQLGTQRTSLEGQRGNLRATYAEQIRGNRFNEAATKANIALQSQQLNESTRQFNESLKNVLPTAASTAGVTSTYGTGGINYFLTDEDLKNLGLVVNNALNNASKTNTGTSNAVVSGYPRTQKYNTSGKWAPYGQYGF